MVGRDKCGKDKETCSLSQLNDVMSRSPPTISCCNF